MAFAPGTQRRRLAVKGKVLGRKLLLQIANIACPDTILRWHSRLVAEKWDYSDRRKKVGRPRIGKELVDLVVRMAKENPTWGYDRIEGALKNLRYRISSSSIGNILKAHGNVTRCYPRPTYGMLVAITVMLSTLAESGRLAI